MRATLGLSLLLIIGAAGSSARAEPASPLLDSLRAYPYRLAWESYRDGNSDLWSSKADGTDVRNLTNTPTVLEHYARFSPDGSKLCFTVDSGEGRDAVRSLWVADADGSNRRRLADHAREPFWSPDGKVIGYLPQEYGKFDVIDYYTKGMVYYHLDTGLAEPHPNTANLRHLYHPSFAPNGKWIAAVVHGGMGFGHTILLIEAHGSRIIDLKIPGCRPAVSPDGKHIAWGSDDHEVNTAVLDTDSENPAVGQWQLRVHDDKNKVYHICWSPDGKFVAFSRGPDGEGDLSKPGTFTAACEIIGVYAKGWDIYVAAAEPARRLDLNAAGPGDFLQITHDGNSNKEPTWYPVR